MRSIAMGNNGHRIGQKKELNCQAAIIASVNSMRTPGAGMTFRDKLIWAKGLALYILTWISK